MAKKIRFPLVLADGTQTRSLDELKEHFDLESVLGHYKSGKLLTWLRDRYIEDEANAIEALDENAPDFQQKLCDVFGVEFSGVEVDVGEITCRQERLAKLRQFTDEAEFIQNIDAVAFDQEELADLLDEDFEKIYLCGERFTVPASMRNKTYVGVNSPNVKISGDTSNWDERNISFSECQVEGLELHEKQGPFATKGCSDNCNIDGLVSNAAIKNIRTVSRTFSYSKKDIDDALAGASMHAHTSMDDYFRDAANRIAKVRQRGDMEESGTKKVEDFYPFFSSFDLPTFAKIYLAEEMLWLSFDEVRSIKVNGMDKYMLSFLEYYDVEYTGHVIDNIPVGLSGDSLAIAKAIAGNRLSNEEAKTVSNYMEMVKNYQSLYVEYWGVVDCAANGNTGHYDKGYFYETLAKARATGWFDNCPDPTDEEISYHI